MPLQLEGASRESLGALREALSRVAPADKDATASDLFAGRDLLAGNLGLTRALTDTASDPAARGGLVERLLGSQVGAPALGLVRAAVAARWAEGRDLGDALEQVGVEALLDVAEDDGTLDAVEDDLFRFGRILETSPQLALALSDPAAPTDAKVSLVRDLLAAKASPVATRLVERAVRAPGGLPLDRVLLDTVELAAAHRMRLVATVRTARPLSAEQTERLARALHQVYGRTIQVQSSVEPALVGGLTVHVAGEVVDGSVLRRLAQARAALTR